MCVSTLLYIVVAERVPGFDSFDQQVSRDGGWLWCRYQLYYHPVSQPYLQAGIRYLYSFIHQHQLLKMGTSGNAIWDRTLIGTASKKLFSALIVWCFYYVWYYNYGQLYSKSYLTTYSLWSAMHELSLLLNYQVYRWKETSSFLQL